MSWADRSMGISPIIPNSCSRTRCGRIDSVKEEEEGPVTVNPQPAPRPARPTGHDRGSPLYHRHDGHYGLLTPQASLVMSLCPQERGRVVAASCCGGRTGCLVSSHFLFRG